MENIEGIKPNQIYCGDSLEILSRMEDESIHCSVSSPPYFSLRKYQGAQTCEWPVIDYPPVPGLPPIHIEAMTCALGHEEAVEAYIGHLVMIYKEVWRVLREDGCAWLVMGDSFASQGKSGLGVTDGHGNFRGGAKTDNRVRERAIPINLQQGDLMMVPHRLALALQADGWIVRNDVVWHKKSPMPESVSGWKWERHKVKVKKSDRANNVYQSGAGTKQGAGVASRAQREAYYEQGEGASEFTDCPGCPKCEPNGGYVLRRGSWRHTRAHEFVFMMVKKMQYFANQEAVREALANLSLERMNQPTFHQQKGGPKDYGIGSNRSARKMLENLEQSRSGRNPRSVISPKPESYPGPHFAVYPSTLIKSLIEATCPARCCPECGAGWASIVERGFTAHDGKTESLYSEGSTANRLALLRQAARERGQEYQNTNKVLGYRPTCKCGREDHVPGVVLDPFVGSGTTCIVAKQLGRRWIGLDISEEYCGLAQGRIDATQAPLFVL